MISVIDRPEEESEEPIPNQIESQEAENLIEKIEQHEVEEVEQEKVMSALHKSHLM